MMLMEQGWCALGSLVALKPGIRIYVDSCRSDVVREGWVSSCRTGKNAEWVFRYGVCNWSK